MVCYNCTRRKLGCHANCPDYLEFRRKRDKLNEQKCKDNEVSYATFKRIAKNRLIYR